MSDIPLSDEAIRHSPHELASTGEHRTRAGSRRHYSLPLQIAAGIAAALVAVAVRYSLPLLPTQLPVLTVVIALALTTTFIGLPSGIATAVIGGLLSWYLFFTAHSWEFSPGGAIPLFGFVVTASVIITTSHLYRVSEQRNHRAELSALQKEAEAAQLFARELAHRLKNTLAVVQGIAFRTFGTQSPQSHAFAGRLKALGDVHDLLSEHVERPTARVNEVINAALLPFDEGQQHILVECVDTPIVASQAVNLALAVHELTTNAVKHGALSNGTGWVSLKAEECGDSIRLIWEEHEGPQVTPPSENGFGMKLLKSVGSEPEFQFEPSGLRCSLSVRKG